MPLILVVKERVLSLVAGVRHLSCLLGRRAGCGFWPSALQPAQQLQYGRTTGIVAGGFSMMMHIGGFARGGGQSRQQCNQHTAALAIWCILLLLLSSSIKYEGN